MRKYTCDKCGREVNSVDDLFKIRMYQVTDRDEFTDSEKELCRLCASYLLRAANTPDQQQEG